MLILCSLFRCKGRTRSWSAWSERDEIYKLIVSALPRLAQPQIYRSIIDDVVANVQVDFEEYGMEEEVLLNLQAVGCIIFFSACSPDNSPEMGSQTP